MKYYVFKEGDQFCSAFFDNEVDLMIFLHDTEIERFEVVILSDSDVYRVCCLLCDGFKITSIYDLLKFIKDLKDGNLCMFI